MKTADRETRPTRNSAHTEMTKHNIPAPFVFDGVGERHYIDFENADDPNDGKTRENAWKRHPMDPQYGGRTSTSAAQYIFKRGVFYRGSIIGKFENMEFTTHPACGEGEAVIYGSEIVTSWRQGATNKSIPDAENAWYADLDFAPRNLWMIDGNGNTHRIPLAREPNWTVSDPKDVMSELAPRFRVLPRRRVQELLFQQHRVGHGQRSEKQVC